MTIFLIIVSVVSFVIAMTVLLWAIEAQQRIVVLERNAHTHIRPADAGRTDTTGG